MNPTFSKKPSLLLRCFFVIVIGILLILISSSNNNTFTVIRKYLDNSINNLYIIAKYPIKIINTISNTFTSYKKINLENKILRRTLFLKQTELLLLDSYKQENVILRKLLDVPFINGEKKMFTQVISNIMNPYISQFIIDKGKINGVYEGQIVINNLGLVGRISSVGNFISRVSLICNISNSLPLVILRNNIHVIANGKGCNKDLEIEDLPINPDIKIGDILVTSGLDGFFMKGYPVGIVSFIDINKRSVLKIVKVHPIVNFNNLNYVLLIWHMDNIINNK